MSNLFTVKEIDARKGRGLVANIDLERNAELFTVPADITTLYSSFTNSTCVLCFSRDKESLTVCPSCQQLALCSRCSSSPAGTARWDSHKQPCEWMTLLPAETQRGDTDYLRFLLEYSARVQNGDTRLLMALDTLCTNEDSTAPEVREFCDSFSRLVTTKFAPHGLLIAQAQLKKLLLQTKSNSVGFPFDEQQTLGWTLQEEVCMLNHSCVPNCAITNGPDGTLQIRTIAPVKAEEELTISYVDLSGPLGGDVKARTRELLERYRFLCQCDRCKTQRSA